jgi:thioredoxin-like negative regulator of GroEL
MIEIMLEAERAIGIGLLDQAERLYGQVVAHDPKNSIAVTGLARVALERGDQLGAYLFARRALALDPENHMARHLSLRMAEQMRNRGEPVPDDEGNVLPSTDAAMPLGPAASARAAPVPAAAVEASPPSAESVTPVADPLPARPGLVDRLLRRRR